jgi:hypothetical protein
VIALRFDARHGAPCSNFLLDTSTLVLYETTVMTRLRESLQSNHNDDDCTVLKWQQKYLTHLRTLGLTQLSPLSRLAHRPPCLAC